MAKDYIGSVQQKKQTSSQGNSLLQDVLTGNWGDVGNALQRGSTAALKGTFGLAVDDQGKIAATDPQKFQNAIIGGGTGSDIAPAAKEALSVVSPAVNSILHPISTLGNKVESLAEAAGPVPNKVLEDKFGTTLAPNSKLTEGLSTASGKTDLEKLLRREIATQGRSAGGEVSGTNYKDVLNYKKGAYGQAYDKLAPKAQQGYYKKVGNAYKDILHQNVPGIAKYDKTMSALYSIQKYAPTLLKALGVSGGGLGVLQLLNELGNRSTSSSSNQP